MKRVLRQATWVLSAGLLTALTVSGCSTCSSKSEIVQQPPPKPLAAPVEEEAPGFRLEFFNSDRDLAFSVEVDKDKGTMKGSRGELLARYQLWGTGIRIKDADGKTVAYLAGGQRKIELKKSEITKAHHIFRRRPQGSWAVRNQAGKLAYVAKKRDWGYLVADPKGEAVFRARSNDDSTVLQNANRKPVYMTMNDVNSTGVAWLGIDDLTLPERGALLLHFQLQASL